MTRFARASRSYCLLVAEGKPGSGQSLVPRLPKDLPHPCPLPRRSALRYGPTQERENFCQSLVARLAKDRPHPPSLKLPTSPRLRWAGRRAGPPLPRRFSLRYGPTRERENFSPMICNGERFARFMVPMHAGNRRGVFQGPVREMVLRAPSADRKSLGLLSGLIAVILFTTGTALGQNVIWDGHDATNGLNFDWSDANNWSGGIPGPGTNIYFFDPGASSSQGVVNNVVDGNTTVLSLTYGNTNGSHETEINPGVTLTISNNAGSVLFFEGTGNDNGSTQTLYSAMTGFGSFAVIGTNSASEFIVQQGSGTSGSHMATLDLSGLTGFNAVIGRLLIGGNGGSSGDVNRPCGTIDLAGTNMIRVNGTAPAIDVGDGPSNGGSEAVYLGKTNAIFADTMTIARQKCTATVMFNPSLSANPVLDLNGNTNSRMNLLAIGDFSAQSSSGSTVSGTVNLTGGEVNAEVNVCDVAEGQSGSGAGTTTGVLELGAGLFNVNTLNVGYGNSASAAGSVTGTVSITNGTLVINHELLLGYNPGAPATVSGTLAIRNGTVLADSIVAGGGNSDISLTGGLLVISNSMGSAGAPLSSLTVAGGGTLQFGVANSFTNAVVNQFSSDNSGVIDISAMPIVLAYPSQYPLIECPGGGAGGVKAALGSLPGGYQGYISNDNSSMIWLVITNGPALPKLDQWRGAANDNWDTNSLNWSNAGMPAAYSEGDQVQFNDAAQTGTVNLAGTARHTPLTWTVTNNTVNYIFAGSNSVGGTTALVKSGAASASLSESDDDFSGGITVNGGTLILDEPASAVSGGLTIATGATAQIGNGDARGALPSGGIVDNGNLVFNQTTTSLEPASISGTGSLTQNGAGVLELSGGNTYSGNTVVQAGTLALTNNGSISQSANVEVTDGTLDVSGLAGGATLESLNMTNGAINVGPATVNVSELNLGGSGNTMNAAALPGFLYYPTNVTLIKSAGGIQGYNFTLGALPPGAPAYAGSLAQEGNAVVLTLSSGPLAVVQATVTFSSINAGHVLNPAYCGLSYEKGELTGSLFSSNDVSLLSMFRQIAPAVLRVGGNSVDTTCWGGISNKTPITVSDVDAFAGFVNALPTNWHVIYGINMSVNSPTNCAAEAAYVAKALGSRLLGFEIGNECDLYHGNGIRASSYTYADFVSQWQALAGAITNAVPGWAITNGGNGWTLTGPASAGNTTGYTVPFATNEEGIISLLTQHYYRANGQSPSSTMAFLLQPDTSLPGTVSKLVAAATNANLPLGFRMDECGSYYNGGAPNVSDAYGAALWALDFMFTLAENGCQGINFHGGGDGTGYTPIADNGTSVVEARPEFYAEKMFSLADEGSVIPAAITLSSNINFTAYGIRRPNGGISVLLNNKDTNNGVEVSINLGADVTAAQAIELTGTNLNSTNAYTLGGARINPDGSWSGGVQSVTPATNGQVSFLVPPISAVLLNPAITGTNITMSVASNQITLSWPTNYLGWVLQSNSAGLEMANDWFAVPGSSGTNRFQMTIDPNMTNVFYRMESP
jgi:autotransporter-associated beta strand protein